MDEAAQQADEADTRVWFDSFKEWGASVANPARLTGKKMTRLMGIALSVLTMVAAVEALGQILSFSGPVPKSERKIGPCPGKSTLSRIEILRHRLLLLFLAASSVGFPTTIAIGSRASDWHSLIGSRAPEWNNRDWINSKPLNLSDLRGKVVLLRFFMESTCPMCSATAPSLNYFYSKYKAKGFVVVGMYTPKPFPEHHSVDQVRKYVRDFGFEFPVALDNDWSTLNAFWLKRVLHPDFTSVSFLIDRKGVIRFIHPGGEYNISGASKNSRQAFFEMEKMIQRLISERE
ncbi:MAG TPA: redoxin domain-containing protein [Acidobacteriota bacterium]|jgi:peroxiredoxin